MWAEFLKVMRSRWKTLVVTAGISVLLIWMYVSMFPSIQEEAEKMNEMLAAFPDSMIQIFGIEGGDLFTELESFLTVEYYSMIWPLLVIILGITTAVPVAAGEVEDGTMDLMLSLPLSRARQFIAKYAGGIVVMTLFTLVSVLCVFPFGWIYGVELASESHFTVLLAGWLFGAAIYSINAAISTVFSSKGASISLMAGWIFLMYLANVLASLQGSLEWMQDLSFFYYFEYREALLGNSVPTLSFVVFSAAIVVGCLVGFLRFRNRDVLS